MMGEVRSLNMVQCLEMDRRRREVDYEAEIRQVIAWVRRYGTRIAYASANPQIDCMLLIPRPKESCCRSTRRGDTTVVLLQGVKAKFCSIFKGVAVWIWKRWYWEIYSYFVVEMVGVLWKDAVSYTQSPPFTRADLATWPQGFQIWVNPLKGS